MKFELRKVLNVIRTLLSFMNNDKWDSRSNVDFDDSETVRNYLEHNLSEGYLSADEQKFVDELIKELDEVTATEDLQEVVKEIQLNEDGGK